MCIRDRIKIDLLVDLSANFSGKGASPTNYCWCQKTGVIAFSCGRPIKISAVYCLVLSQRKRVTDRRTDRQNYDSQDRASIAASRGKVQ